MKPVCDYHMHTPLCGHAEGQPAEYAAHAVKMGLEEIGFSDHAPFVVKPLPGITMTMDDLPSYHKMIEDVREQFKDKLTIRVGIEADFVPGYEDKTRAILDAYPYDYVLGSVHFIKNWGFDDPAERGKWDESDVDQVYRDYFDLLRVSAESGLYDVISHPDLVKKFGHRAAESAIRPEVERTAEVFKKAGVAIEINTSGLRKPVKEMYPALWHLEIYAAAGVPLTFGSDSHQPDHVGYDFDKAMFLAKQAGFKEYVLFKERKVYRKERIV